MCVLYVGKWLSLFFMVWGPATPRKGGGSKWNQAGTYEEKGMSKWLEDRLKSGLIGVKLDEL